MTEIKEAPNKALRTRLAWVRAWLAVYGPVDEASLMGMIEAVLLADLAIVPRGAVATVQFPHNTASVALFFMKRDESLGLATEPSVCRYVLGLDEGLGSNSDDVEMLARVVTRVVSAVESLVPYYLGGFAPYRLTRSGRPTTA